MIIIAAGLEAISVQNIVADHFEHNSQPPHPFSIFLFPYPPHTHTPSSQTLSDQPHSTQQSQQSNTDYPLRTTFHIFPQP